MNHPENFDMIVKIENDETKPEFNEDVAIEKLQNELKNQGPYFYIKESEFDNVFMVELKDKRFKTSLKFSNTPNNNFEIVPIESVVLTRPEKILKNILSISKKKINNGETFAIRCNIKGKKYIKKKEEFIKSVYKEIENINGKPDEIHPDWIIHIEVLGENTGISVLKQNI